MKIPGYGQLKMRGHTTINCLFFDRKTFALDMYSIANYVRKRILRNGLIAALFFKIMISVAVIFSATGISFGQSYQNLPNDTIQVTGLMEDLETLSIQQENTSSDTIQLEWEKVSEMVPQLWEASVCDNQVCYTTLVSGGMMNPINPSEFSFLLLHITPHVNYGTAIIRYAVWDMANPAVKDTLTYILTVSGPSGTSIAKENTGTAIYPNPATETICIQLSNEKQLLFEIFNVMGKKVYSGISSTTFKVSVADWENGMYFLRVISENIILQTKPLVIQH